MTQTERLKMKKAIILLPILATLGGCGSLFGPSDPYEKRALAEREYREKMVDRSLDKAPDWMTKVPTSENAIYAAGTATSGDFSMADDKAKAVALGKICMTAGGEVDKQTKVYMNDSGGSSVENSEMAIRSLCRKVDVTGAEVKDIKRVNEGGRYRTYILMALPHSGANPLQDRKDRIDAQRRAVIGSERAFRELDSQTNKPLQQ